MSRNRVWVLVALVCALVGVPTQAYASEGFLGGLQDLVGVREVEVSDYEEEYLREYGGGLRADPAEPASETPTDLDSEATTVENINATVNGIYNVNWFGTQGTRPWVESLQMFMTGSMSRVNYIVPAIGIVFVWWGARKSIRMVMSAFRKGSVSV